MDFLIAMVGKDFVLAAADCSSARSVVRMKRGKQIMTFAIFSPLFLQIWYVVICYDFFFVIDMDKMLPISPNALLLMAGPGLPN